MALSFATSRLAVAVIFTALPLAAWAGEYDITAFPGDKPAAAPASVSANSALDRPIEILAADPDCKAVIDKDIPGLLSDSHYPMFKTMSLRTVAAMSSGRISKATLSAIDQELDAVPLPPRPTAMSRDEHRPFQAPGK